MKPEDRKRLKQHIEMIVEHKEPIESQGEDFAKYIVSRNCTLPDVSMTQDVTTPEPPEDALHARIAELEAERRWIPCTEQMPKDNEYVLVYCSADGFYNIDCLYDGSWLEAADYYEEDVIVTHWMPLPEPPEVKDE